MLLHAGQRGVCRQTGRPGESHTGACKAAAKSDQQEHHFRSAASSSPDVHHVLCRNFGPEDAAKGKAAAKAELRARMNLSSAGEHYLCPGQLPQPLRLRQLVM